jgi:hypothetical protein
VIAPAADGKRGSERWGSGNNKARGYSRSRFHDAWKRYLPPLTSQDHPAQPALPLENKENSGPDGPSDIRPTEGHRAPGNGAGSHAEDRPVCDTRARPTKSSTRKSKPGPGEPRRLGDSKPSGKDVGAAADGELGPEELL